MALMSTRMTSVQRASGGSALDAAAYAIRGKLQEDAGRMFNHLRYETVDRVQDLGTYLPSGEAVDPEEVWNRAEAAEKRKNAVPARTWRLALPIEFTHEENKKILNDYCAWMREKFNTVTTCGIHMDHKHNPHAHIVFGSRIVDEKGEFGPKLKFFEKKKISSDTIREMRQKWADMCNEILVSHDYSPISAKKYKEQGIDKIPGHHRGPAQHHRMIQELYPDIDIKTAKKLYEEAWYDIIIRDAANDRHKNRAAKGPGTAGHADTQQIFNRPGAPAIHPGNSGRAGTGSIRGNFRINNRRDEVHPGGFEERFNGNDSHDWGNFERATLRSPLKSDARNFGTPGTAGETPQGRTLIAALKEWQRIIDFKTLGGYYNGPHYASRRIDPRSETNAERAKENCADTFRAGA